MNKNKNLIGWLLNVLKILGPGFIVMIADMDAGSITTAFVSGAQYGYKLILIQIILIPLLYMVQEITSRLGCVTGEGHGALIKEHFGIKWAKLTTITLLVVVFSALLSEFAGIAASGEIFGISKIYSVTFSVVVLILVASTGKYKGAENITLIVSIISLIFIPAALLSHPNYNAIFAVVHAQSQIFKSS